MNTKFKDPNVSANQLSCLTRYLYRATTAELLSNWNSPRSLRNYSRVIVRYGLFIMTREGELWEGKRSDSSFDAVYGG